MYDGKELVLFYQGFDVFVVDDPGLARRWVARPTIAHPMFAGSGKCIEFFWGHAVGS